MESITKQLNEIALCSLPGTGVSRLSFSQEHKDANKIIKNWMKSAGLNFRVDDAGSLIGSSKVNSGMPTLIMGSHQDTVIGGGKYDGIMGVLLPILAFRAIDPDKLKYNLEIISFADEEGVRFPTSLIGSRSLAGTFKESYLGFKDKQGTSLENAMEAFGLNPKNILNLKRDRKDLLGFVEVHIEQGPILYHDNKALGVVTSISGIERYHISLHGEAGHAGTTPMHLRQDALSGAARIISQVESSAVSSAGIATVGSINVEPNAVNVIPSKVDLTIEIRAGTDSQRNLLSEDIVKSVYEIANEKNLKVIIEKTYEQKAVNCDEKLMDILSRSVEKFLGTSTYLSSGATHDTSAMSDLCPVAMLFVRCLNGISHNPKELASEEDMQLAVKVIADFLLNLNKSCNSRG